MTIKDRERERYDDEVEICTVEELWYAEIELLSTLESIKSSCNNQKKKSYSFVWSYGYKHIFARTTIYDAILAAVNPYD